MTKYEIVSATEEHGLELARNLRLADAREMWAASRTTPHRGIMKSMKESDECWAGLADGRVVCLFGVVPLSFIGSYGVIWMLATPELEKHARAFLRRNRSYIQHVQSQYIMVFNLVDARNTEAVKWLKWLGFEIEKPKAYGPDGLPFYPFKMRSSNV